MQSWAGNNREDWELKTCSYTLQLNKLISHPDHAWGIFTRGSRELAKRSQRGGQPNQITRADVLYECGQHLPLFRRICLQFNSWHSPGNFRKHGIDSSFKINPHHCWRQLRRVGVGTALSPLASPGLDQGVREIMPGMAFQTQDLASISKDFAWQLARKPYLRWAIREKNSLAFWAKS